MGQSYMLNIKDNHEFLDFLMRDSEFIYKHINPYSFGAYHVPTDDDCPNVPDINGFYISSEAVVTAFHHFMNGNLHRIYRTMHEIAELFGDDYVIDTDRYDFIDSYLTMYCDDKDFTEADYFLIEWILKYHVKITDYISFEAEKIIRTDPNTEKFHKCCKCREITEHTVLPMLVTDEIDIRFECDYEEDEHLSRVREIMIKLAGNEKVRLYRVQLTYFVICINCGDYQIQTNMNYHAYMYFSENEWKTRLVPKDVMNQIDEDPDGE